MTWDSSKRPLSESRELSREQPRTRAVRVGTTLQTQRGHVALRLLTPIAEWRRDALAARMGDRAGEFDLLVVDFIEACAVWIAEAGSPIPNLATREVARLFRSALKGYLDLPEDDRRSLQGIISPIQSVLKESDHVLLDAVAIVDLLWARQPPGENDLAQSTSRFFNSLLDIWIGRTGFEISRTVVGKRIGPQDPFRFFGELIDLIEIPAPYNLFKNQNREDVDPGIVQLRLLIHTVSHWTRAIGRLPERQAERGEVD